MKDWHCEICVDGQIEREKNEGKAAAEPLDEEQKKGSKRKVGGKKMNNKKRQKVLHKAVVDLTGSQPRSIPRAVKVAVRNELQELRRANDEFLRNHKIKVAKIQQLESDNRHLEEQVTKLNHIGPYKEAKNEGLMKHLNEKAKDIASYKKHRKREEKKHDKWREKADVVKRTEKRLKGICGPRTKIIDCKKARKFHKNLKTSLKYVSSMIPDLKTSLKDLNKGLDKWTSNKEVWKEKKKSKESRGRALDKKIEEMQRERADMDISISRITKNLEEARLKKDGSFKLKSRTSKLLKDHQTVQSSLELLEEDWKHFQENKMWLMLSKNPVSEWTAEDIANWFGHLNSNQFADRHDELLAILTKQDIKGEMLIEIERSDWDNWGITKGRFKEGLYVDNKRKELIAADNILQMLVKGFNKCDEKVPFLVFTNFLIDQNIETAFTKLYREMKDKSGQVTIFSIFNWCLQRIDPKKGDLDLFTLLRRTRLPNATTTGEEEFKIQGTDMARIASKPSFARRQFSEQEIERIQGCEYDFSIFEEVYLGTTNVQKALDASALQTSSMMGGWFSSLVSGASSTRVG